jgi:hypothetical protein
MGTLTQITGWVKFKPEHVHFLKVFKDVARVWHNDDKLDDLLHELNETYPSPFWSKVNADRLVFFKSDRFVGRDTIFFETYEFKNYDGEFADWCELLGPMVADLVLIRTTDTLDMADVYRRHLRHADEEIDTYVVEAYIARLKATFQ